MAKANQGTSPSRPTMTAEESEALGQLKNEPEQIDPTKIDPVTGELLTTRPVPSGDTPNLALSRTGDNAIVHSTFATAMQKAAQLIDPEGSAMLGRLALYQGTTTEQANYKGLGFEVGNFIDVLGRERVAEQEVKIVPVYGFCTWVSWTAGSPTPNYVLHDPSRVPLEDLEWAEGKPPKAAKCINMMLLVEGQPWPFVAIFKRTSFQAGDAIFKLEKRREMAGKGRGCYALYSVQEKGGGGVYQKMKYRPAGDIPESLKPLLSMCIADVVAMKNATVAMVDAVTSDADTFNAGDESN